MAKNFFRRGFKTEAERIALELRGELGLSSGDRLEPGLLAEHLAIPVQTLDDLRSHAPEDVRHLLGRGRSAFSAVTIYVSRHRRLIITNPAHAQTRRMSNLCHELGHIILNHEPESPLQLPGGREWNGIQEREADWLAGCLLIPQVAAHASACAGRSDDEVAALYGVSRALARWRMNTTGARIRAMRLARFVG